jgi:hypothetical protein
MPRRARTLSRALCLAPCVCLRRDCAVVKDLELTLDGSVRLLGRYQHSSVRAGLEEPPSAARCWVGTWHIKMRLRNATAPGWNILLWFQRNPRADARSAVWHQPRVSPGGLPELITRAGHSAPSSQ